MILLITLLWVICGVFAYGITFADFQNNHPMLAKQDYRGDLSFSVCVGLCGPFGLSASLFNSGFAQYGLKFK